MVQQLWTPPGTVQEETIRLGRVNPDVTRDSVFVYNFTFVYKGKMKRITVVSDDGTGRAEVEDKAAEAGERWRREMDGKDSKPPPNAAQKAEIGEILNDIHLRNQKMRESSTGRLHFKGTK